ncbi:hypothetical protein H7171_02900 [Candidatus Saccharibacteria bacterium]|nr:hypothetical protein [Candidatus Saccharibacteria bacterium]
MIEIGNVVQYYLAILAVETAILGLVIAGIVTLMQILQNAKPKRDIRLLVSQPVLISYILFLLVILVLLCMGCWTTAFPTTQITQIFLKPIVGGGLLFASVASLLWFLQLVYRARRLLEADEYLSAYLPKVSNAATIAYLLQEYTDNPDEIVTKKNHTVAATKLPDSFQPIRDYLKDSTFKLDESGSVEALYFFDELFDTTFEAAVAANRPEVYDALAKYLAESSLEFFTIFRKASSEKQKEAMIELVRAQSSKFVAHGTDDSVSILIRCLEGLAKQADDDEVIYCIAAIGQLTNQYLAKNESKTWEDIAETFENACLSVTRIAETYYLQADNPLRTVPIISHYTGEYKSVTAELVQFFTTYQDLADRFPETYPVHYFEAVEAVVEALFTRYGEMVEAGLAMRGLNVAYQIQAHKLADIYRIFGTDAIEHSKPELLALCISNLRRIIKPAKNFKLQAEHAEITKVIIDLSLQGLTKLGDITVKADGRTLTAYAFESLAKHVSSDQINQAIDELPTDSLAYAGELTHQFIARLRFLNR